MALKNWLLAAALMTLGANAQAACSGTDMRAQLSQADREMLQARLDDMPFAEGNHWRATRGSDVIHLIGTIHLDDPRLAPVLTRLGGVVEATQMLLVEASPEEEAALQRAILERPELMFLQGATLPDRMNEADWDALSAAISDRGLPVIMASRFQPWYLTVLLSLPPCLTEALTRGEKGLDHHLMTIAQSANVPIRTLEPYDTLFSLFTDTPVEEQIELLMLSLQPEDTSEDMLETLKASYFEQKHGEAWEMSRLTMLRSMEDPMRAQELFAEFEQDLLVARNSAWIPVILKALEAHDNLVVAAGAAHWNGAQGVLALLEREGFTLERLPF